MPIANNISCVLLLFRLNQKLYDVPKVFGKLPEVAKNSPLAFKYTELSCIKFVSVEIKSGAPVAVRSYFVVEGLLSL